jgi:trehalose 6-phosphate phosphatase
VTALPDDVHAALTQIARTPRLLVATDFDGTLAHFVDNPVDARPLPGTMDTLRALAAAPATSATLISGRALDVLGQLSGAPAGVHLIGSHGAEFDGDVRDPVDTALLAEIGAALEAIATRYRGAAVEYKPAGVVLHVRRAAPEDGAAALAQAREGARAWTAGMTEGKAVLEFAVVKTDKGAAIDTLRDRENATAVVFFGDDVTDEKAFARLRGADVGVKVGPGESLARLRVDGPEDVAAALELLLAERTR